MAARGRRWLLPGGGLAAGQMVVFVSVADETRPGYDAGRTGVSQLSLGPGGWVASVDLAMCGA